MAQQKKTEPETKPLPDVFEQGHGLNLLAKRHLKTVSLPGWGDFQDGVIRTYAKYMDELRTARVKIETLSGQNAKLRKMVEDLRQGQLFEDKRRRDGA